MDNPPEAQQLHNDRSNETTNSNFLDLVVNELIQNVETIETNCDNKAGEEIVELRIKQLAYAKLLVNVYEKDVSFLTKAYTSLGVAYLDIGYLEQAQEHLQTAFKLNESSTEETHDQMNRMKEHQIKILINLSRCFLESDKAQAALSISEKSLKMNETLMGETHISNADIYYVLAKIHTHLKNYKTATEFLSKMFQMYEKIYGFNSEKSAKICMELGQVYELAGNLPDALEYYSFAYKIWEKVLSDSPSDEGHELIVEISVKLGELHTRSNQIDKAYETLKACEGKYAESYKANRNTRVQIKRMMISATEAMGDLALNAKELSDMVVSALT